MGLQDLYINFINSNYKRILIVNIFLFIILFGYVLYNYFSYGRVFDLSVEITGGYLIILPSKMDIEALKSLLIKANAVDYSFYQTGGKIYIEAKELNREVFIKELENYGITENEITFQQFSSYIGEIIFRHLVLLLIISTIIISFVIWIRFRDKRPVSGIISVILWDFVLVITLINLLGIKVGPIGLVTLIGILGFAINNNILLATNVFQEKERRFEDRIKMSLKVSLLMELFIVLVVVPLYLLVDLPVIREFSSIWLLIVLADSYSYLFLNIPIYKYFEAKHQQ